MAAFKRGRNKTLAIREEQKANLFTSVYDEKSVDFAVSLGTIAFKVAAFELTNLKLIKKL